jgi:hypothetical protein
MAKALLAKMRLAKMPSASGPRGGEFERFL